MQLQIDTGSVEQADVDALVFICFEKESAEAAPMPAQQSGWLKEIRDAGEFSGKLYEMSVLHRPGGLAARRLVVVGGGSREKFTTVEARRLAGVVVRTLRPKGVKSVGVFSETSGADLACAFAEGAVLGEWESDKHKTDPKKDEKKIELFKLLVAEDAPGLQEAVERGRIIAEAQNASRELVNEPANLLSPEKLAEAAQETAKTFGMSCVVLNQEEMAKLGMGALLAVGQGSENPPFLIAIKYQPGEGAGSDHLALVGKGVTFDTGGNSIKSADGMERMKYDMAGAAAVIGAMRAIAQLKPAVSVTGYIPTVENMLSGKAMRPGDIVTTLAGKTVEILNTDAEGRLILADAIAYAKQEGASHIVDAATLTGAIGIALGHYNIGAFTNDEEFLARFMAAARSAGEKTWQLPMDEEYKDYLKSAFADLPNIGGRYGGSITAAWFLREFADPTPWVHLDIAATAWLDDGRPWLAKGPSGVGVRSFVELALDWGK